MFAQVSNGAAPDCLYGMGRAATANAAPLGPTISVRGASLEGAQLTIVQT